jgi:uncharacterized protein YwgA
MVNIGLNSNSSNNIVIEVLQTRKKVLGKIDCQKTMYFAKRLGATIPFNFRWNIFGPYSYSLAHSCDFLVMEGILQYTGMEYKLNQDALEGFPSSIAPEIKERLAKFFKAIESICVEKEYDRVYFIECTASLDFIQANVSEAYRKKEKTFRLLEQLKPHKKMIFRRMRNDAWNLLASEHLVS